MERRDFPRQGTLAAVAAGSRELPEAWARSGSPKTDEPIAERRLGAMDVHVSISGIGGIRRDFPQITEGRRVQA